MPITKSRDHARGMRMKILLAEDNEENRADAPDCIGRPARDRRHAAVARGARAWEASAIRGCRMMKILVIEDDSDTANYIVKGLTQQGHVVDRAPDGRDGLFLAAGEKYDVLIVDRMLPGLDGLAIVKTIRGAGVKTPILFLTAVDGIDDRVEGLEAGGDDYLVKPFAFAELAARVNALFRRPALAEAGTALCVGELQMDLLRRIVRRGDQVIELQPREFRLLEY